MINVYSFVLRGRDKRQARLHRYRISEKKLLVLSGLGGWLGALVGMQCFRHKTLKNKFLYKFWIIVSLWIAGWMFVLYYS